MQSRWHLHSAANCLNDIPISIHIQRVYESMITWCASHARMPSLGAVSGRSLLVTLLMTHLGKCRRTQHEPLPALHWDTIVVYVLMTTVKLPFSLRDHQIPMLSMPDSTAFAGLSSWMCKNLGVSGPEWDVHISRFTLPCIEAYPVSSAFIS